MKKNKMMRIASVLLVAVLLSTCAISGTFAKYIEIGGAGDSARVAAWGVEITGKTEGENSMFTTDDSTLVSASEAVVAPGMSGTLTQFDVKGTPEVATTVTYAATVEVGENWMVDGKFYCPIVVTVTNKNGTTAVNGLDYAEANDFENKIVELIVDATKDYNAAETLDNVDSDLTVEWNWAFENAKGEKNEQSNPNDTILGNAATKATISVNVTVTISQRNS